MQDKGKPFVAVLLASLCWPLAADTPIATTLYREGDGRIEGDLLADSVKSVSAAGTVVTVVQRDATATESTLEIDVAPAAGSLTKEQLVDSLETTIDHAVQVDGIDLSGQELRFASGDGTLTRITLPSGSATPAWSGVTGKPATATRWPTYGEVTGAKPPSNAQANIDQNAATTLLDYRRSASYALASGHAASLARDTGADLLLGDDSITLTASGLAGSAVVDVAALRGKPAVAADTNLLLAGRTGDAIAVTLQGRQFYIARTNSNDVLVADGQVAETRTIGLAIDGHRVAVAADVRSDARWPKVRLPADTLFADTQRFTDADETKLDSLGDANHRLISQSTVTPVLLGGDIVANRASGVAIGVRGTFAAESGPLNRRLQFFEIDLGDADLPNDGVLTVWMPGAKSDYAGGDVLRVGGRKVRIGDAYLDVAQGNYHEFEWRGNFDSWATANAGVVVALLEPAAAVPPPADPGDDDKILMGRAGEWTIQDLPPHALRADDYSEITGAKPPVDAVSVNGLPFPASQDFESNSEGQLQIVQHAVIRAVNRETAFAAVPVPGQAQDRFATVIDGIGRLTYYPAQDADAASRGAFVFSPRGDYRRRFGPTTLTVATAADGTDQQALALTDIGSGRLRSAVASAENALSAAGSRWLNFTNADGSAQFVNPDDPQFRQLALSDFAGELALRSAPVTERASRPATGWPAATAYARGGAAPIPFRFDSSADDQLWLRVGVTGHGTHALHASLFGGYAWSPWMRVQDIKTWPRLATPFATGGENFHPRFHGDEAQTDYRVAVNAAKVVAHEILTLRVRVDSDGYLRFWCDQWARLGNVVLQHTHYPRPF